MAEVITHPLATAPAGPRLRPYSSPDDNFNPYSPQVTKGSGFESIDNYVADRISVISNPDELVATLPAVTAQLKTLDQQAYLDYVKSSIAATFESSRQRMLDAYSSTMASATPEDQEILAAEAAEKIRTLDELNGPDAIAALSAAALKELDLFGEDTVGKYTAKSQYMAMMLEVLLQKNGMDLKGFKEHALDFLGAAIPFRQWTQLAIGSLGKQGITPAAYYRNVKAFRAATTKEQFEALPQLVNALAQYSGGNVSLFTNYIMPYFGQSDVKEVLAWLALDAVDAALTAKAAPSMLRMARVLAARNTPIKLLRDAGKRAKAGELVAEAAGDPKTAAALRTTQEDAAASMSPFQGEGIDPALTNGIAAESQLYLANRVAAVEKSLAPINDASQFIQHANFTPEQIEKLNAPYLAQAAGNARIVEQFPDGFLMEVSIDTPSVATPTRKSLQLRLVELEDQVLARTDELHEAKLSQASPYSTSRPVADIEQELVDISNDLQLTKKRLEDLGPPTKTEIAAQLDTVEAGINDLSKRIDSLHAERDVAEAASASPYGEAVAGSPSELAAQQERLIGQRQELIRLQTRLRTQLAKAPEAPAPTAATPQTSRLERIYYRYDAYDELLDTESSATFVDQYIMSPDQTVDVIRPGTVPEATVRDMTAVKIYQQFGKAFREAAHGLRKSARRKIDRILIQGDKEGRAFTALELEAGIKTPYGLLRLRTEQEQAAYFSFRKIFDRMHPYKNEDVRRALIGENYTNSIKITAEDGEEFLSFLKEQNTAAPRRVYDQSSGKILDMPKRAVADTRKLYKTKYPIELNGEQVDFVLADANALQGIPDQVLRYRPGYVPRINRNIFWVASDVREVVRNGVSQLERTAARFFDNLADANQWVKMQRAKGKTAEVAAGREWLEAAPGNREKFEAQIFGGLYTGKRAEYQIPFGLEGTEADRVGAFEALEAYMNHVAQRMSAADFRMSLIRRFIKSSADGMGGSYLTEPGNWRSALRSDTPPNVRTNLEIWRNWTLDQLRIPTTEERVWGTIMQRIAELGATLPFKPVRRIASGFPMKIGAKDVVASLRGTAFHATLGWFTPVQLLVQGFGMALGAAIDPIGFVANIPRLMGLRYAMFATDVRVLEQIGKALGLNNKDFLEMMRAYRKTGLHESTLMTADYTDIHGGWASASTLRAVARKGLIFFQEGERAMRNMAWLQAYDKIKAERKLKVFSDKDISDALKLSLKYTMNLHRANRAAWQKGILSIPTQFFQIFTKFIENMSGALAGRPGAAWTRAQASRILLSHLALFGAAGVPAGESILKNVLYWGQSEDEWGLAIKDDKTLMALTDGLVGLLTYSWTGERFDISSRLSIPSNVQFLIDVASQGDQSLTEQFLGVSSTIMHRSYLAATHIFSLIWPVVKDPSLFEPEIFLHAADSVASITSSWSNVRKARWYWANMAIMNARGQKVEALTSATAKTVVWAQALGISPKDLSDLRRHNEFRLADQREIRDVTRDLIELTTRYETALTTIGPKLSDQYVEAMIASMVAGYSHEDKVKIMNSLYEHKAKTGFLLPEAIDKTIEIMIKNGGAAEPQIIGSMLEEK